VVHETPSFVEWNPAEGWWATHLRRVGTIAHPLLREVSGIVRSGLTPGLWWVHNDSGDSARLFAIDRTGRVMMPAWKRGAYFTDQPEPDKQPWYGVPVLGGHNQDWEDLALESDFIYISDMGNNGNARRDLGVYLVTEPNPTAIDIGTRPLMFIPVRYPDQDAYPPSEWRFDCEALFVDSGRLYFLTKYRADGDFSHITTGTSLYRLDERDTTHVNSLTLIHRADQLPIIPTAADLSPGGDHLAVLCRDAVWLFPRPDEGDDWLQGPAVRVRLPEWVGQVEGICWDDANHLRLVNEPGELFVLDVGSLKPSELSGR